MDKKTQENKVERRIKREYLKQSYGSRWGAEFDKYGTAEMKKFGDDGWELVNFIQTKEGGFIFVFKRPVLQ